MPAIKNFYTYADAQAALQALEIQRQADHLKRYNEDPRLHARPKGLYGDWRRWEAFLNSKNPSS